MTFLIEVETAESKVRASLKALESHIKEIPRKHSLVMQVDGMLSLDLGDNYRNFLC